MYAILKQALYLAIALIGVYAFLLALSYALVPGLNERRGLDSSRSEDSIFTTDPKYVFLNRAAVRPDASRIVFVGASNTAVGFKQREVQKLVPSSEVDNLSVGGSNMTQVAQVVDLVQDLQDPAARRRTTFVIGMWYGMFVQDGFRWATPDRHKGDTDIDIERYRYGFYRRSDAGPKQLLPSNELSLGVVLIHPYLVFDDLSRLASKGLRERLSGKPPRRTDAERNAAIVSEPDRAFALNYWREQMHSDGPIAEEQFLVLNGMIARILAQGSKAVLVDLPIPRWHAERSPFYASYLNRRKALLSELKGKPDFSFLEMADQADDLDFSDEVHPKPRVTPLWAAQVAALLQRPRT
ncbi:MAG TPA: hypothetical protein VHW95_08645 [Steroidobacteraceae bacterium]|jgi:hypothetical protein|nr:hypothetical protein [Steroidobacteraceae bacterium]